MIIWKNWTIWSRWNAHTIEVSRNYDSYWIWRLELGLWNDGATVTSTVTDPIWWLYDDDSFKILVTETLFSAMNRTVRFVPQLLNRAQHLKVVTNTFRHQYRCCQIWPTFAIHRKQPYARKNQTVFYIMWRCIRSLGCNFHFEIYNFYYVENYNSRRPHGIFLFEYTEWIHVKFWAAIFMFLYFSKSFFN